MRLIKRTSATPNFVPDYMAKSVQDVDFKKLRKTGVKFIAFDADSTLVNFRGKALSDDTKLFLQKQRKLFEGWCIASNRLTNDLLPIAQSMDAQVVRATILNRKPQQHFFRQVIKHFGGKPHEVAMVGDKLIADMYGAKKAGMVTVWVERIGKDNIWDRLIRLRDFEKWLIRRTIKEFK
ncbi:hypothetical protein BH23PAT1_BH23PAT1_0690 [soil metagenome]